MTTHKRIIDGVFLGKQKVELIAQIDILDQMKQQVLKRIDNLKNDLRTNRRLYDELTKGDN